MGISGNQSKFIKSLHQKKYRQKYNKFVVEGEKMVVECIRDQPALIAELFCTSPFLDKSPDIEKSWISQFNIITEREMEKISALNSPSPALAVMHKIGFDNTELYQKKGKVLFLDNIKDPGNLGSILRIAEWFGVIYIILSDQCVDVYNPKVVQASMGSILRMPTVEMNCDAFLSFCMESKLPMISASLSGESIYDINPPKHAIICIGSESHGLTEQIEIKSAYKIKIPAATTNKSESLNAAIATGIILAIL
jgi:RNA methyltransferase, TrmH family